MRLRERVLRAAGKPEEQGFLLKTLRGEGRGDFVVALGVLSSLSGDVPDEYVGDVVSASRRLLDTDVGVAKDVAAQALNNLKGKHPKAVEQVVRGLIQSVREQKPVACENAADSLGRFIVSHSDIVLPEALRMSEEYAGNVQKSAILALGRFGSAYPTKLGEVLPALTRLASKSDESEWASVHATGALGTIGVNSPDAVLPALIALAGDKSRWVRDAAADSLGRIGVANPDKLGQITPVFASLVKDDAEWVRQTVAESLGVIIMEHPQRGREFEQMLGSLKNDPSKWVRECVADARNIIASGRVDKKSFMQRLTGYREPAYATPDYATLDERLSSLSSMTQLLRKEYPGVLGVVVFGGIEKGYAGRLSDIDYAILGQSDLAVKTRFEELAGQSGLEVCPLEQYAFDEKSLTDANPSTANLLFTGLFFGDRKKLSGLQKRFFDNATPEQWDDVRFRIIRENTEFKLRRYGFSDEEVAGVAVVRTVMYTPPAYDEMKKTFAGRRT